MSDMTQSFMHMQLGRYEILDRLGTGGMARVFKARDTNLDRVVAVKVLHEHLADDPNFKDRFEREAKLVAALNHPNIVQVYDFNFVERDGRPIFYMVMSFVPGRTLRDVLDDLRERKSLLPHDRVLEMMLSLTGALAYAHDRGMIHRDVKPANILMDEREQPVLTDFGIARLAQGSSLTQEGVTVGTPAYMSPEQATGEMVDHRTDLYALGIIFYELLTGHTPFADDGTLSVLLKHLNEPVPSLSRYIHVTNPYLDYVAFKALAKDPNERYATAEEFARDLKMAFAGQMPEASAQTSTSAFTALKPRIQAPAASPGQQPANAEANRPITRSPLMILAVGFAVIAGLLFIGLLNERESESSTPPTSDVSAVESMTGGAESMIGGAESMTGNPFFTSSFDADDMNLVYWPQGSQNMVTREVLPGGYYRISSQLSNRAVATIFDQQYAYDDLVIQMTAVLQEESSPSGGYGIIFRYLDDDNYNVFAVDGMGRFSIWVREDGVWRELRSAREHWTPDDAVHSLGEANTLLIEISGDELKGYVNGTLLTTITDDTIAAGSVGIYVATPPDGSINLLVDAYVVLDESPLSAETPASDE